MCIIEKRKYPCLSLIGQNSKSQILYIFSFKYTPDFRMNKVFSVHRKTNLKIMFPPRKFPEITGQHQRVQNNVDVKDLPCDSSIEFGVIPGLTWFYVLRSVVFVEHLHECLQHFAFHVVNCLALLRVRLARPSQSAEFRECLWATTIGI